MIRTVRYKATLLLKSTDRFCKCVKKKAIRESGWLFSVKFALRASEIASL